MCHWWKYKGFCFLGTIARGDEEESWRRAFAFFGVVAALTCSLISPSRSTSPSLSLSLSVFPSKRRPIPSDSIAYNRSIRRRSEIGWIPTNKTIGILPLSNSPASTSDRLFSQFLNEHCDLFFFTPQTMRREKKGASNNTSHAIMGNMARGERRRTTRWRQEENKSCVDAHLKKKKMLVKIERYVMLFNKKHHF